MTNWYEHWLLRRIKKGQPKSPSLEELTAGYVIASLPQVIDEFIDCGKSERTDVITQATGRTIDVSFTCRRHEKHVYITITSAEIRAVLYLGRCLVGVPWVTVDEPHEAVTRRGDRRMMSVTLKVRAEQ